MLYRILRELGSMDSAKRQAAIRMARGLPWEDLEQFLAFYDKGQEDARRNAWTLVLILLVVCVGTVFLFSKELNKLHLLFIAGCAAAAVPLPVALSYFGSRRRAETGLQTVLAEIDDPAFVPIALGILSEKHADTFSFRSELLRAISRLLPEVTLEQCREWTPEERHALSLGLDSLLPVSAGGRDALSHSPHDFAILILKVLQRIGDSREIERVRLVSTIDPITEAHQKVREASVKCLKSIEKRLKAPGAEVEIPEVVERARNPARRPVRGIETDVGHLLKQPRTPRPKPQDQSG